MTSGVCVVSQSGANHHVPQRSKFGCDAQILLRIPSSLGGPTARGWSYYGRRRYNVLD
jgi:hypothetical protein